MSVFEIEYADDYGRHTEVVDARDSQAAIQEFRLQHCDRTVEVLDCVRVGEVE